MTTRKIMTATFFATMIASTIMVARKCRSSKANRNEGYRRERRGAKRFTEVPRGSH